MAPERLINRRQQGDLGEASAIEWLTRQGANVFIPIGHSPHVDLVAELDDRLLRIQVKTSTQSSTTPDGHRREVVNLATSGGNQSWNRIRKKLDPERFDLLFVLAGSGRRWLIPSHALEGVSAIRLGGTKYSEFEISGADEISSLVLGTDTAVSKLVDPDPGERRSWRAGPACKVGATLLSEFESHLPHSGNTKPLTVRQLGTPGQSILRRKRQITMPAAPMDQAELSAGDRLRWRADGPGRLIIERIEEAPSLFEAEEPERTAG